MLQALGELYAQGVAIDFESFYRRSPARPRVVDLPCYRWRRERYWIDTQRREQQGASKTPAGPATGQSIGNESLPGYYIRAAAQPDTHLWQTELSLESHADLNDHRVKGKAVLPAASYLQMALKAARQALGEGPRALEEVSLKEALILPEDGAVTMQLIITTDAFGAATFNCYSIAPGSAVATLRASGVIRSGAQPTDSLAVAEEAPFEIKTRCVERNVYRPLPMRVFSIVEGPQAFRHMAQAKHIGKIILSLPETGREPERPLLSVRRAHGQIRADATYLITGGLGALGLLAAEWLVEQGARHLALIGRTDPSENALAAVERLRQSGAAVVTARADVSRHEELARVVTQTESAMPPLRGIIHAAGLLADGAVQRMTREQLYQVMAPKVAGAWNLHELTLSHDLDFFALYSSAASFIGSPGQAGYAAGNAFLDGLAHYRRAHGLKALSINWGSWSEAGMAARPDRGGRLVVRGVESLSSRQSLAAFELLLKQGGGQFAVMPFDCAKWQRFYPATSKTSLFVRLAQNQAQSQTVKKESSDDLSASDILGAAPSERTGLLQSYLSQIIAKVLGHSEFVRLSPEQPLNRLGIDSLMAIEIKNAIESNLGVPVPMVDLLGGKSLAQLTAHILERAPRSSIGSTTSVAAYGNEPAEAEIGAGQAGDEPFVIELTQERLAWAVAAGDEENEQEWEAIEL